MICSPDWLIGFIGALFLAGIVFGCLTVTKLGDVYGRKPIYLLGLFMNLVLTILIILNQNDIILFVLLFFYGLSITARYYVGYTFNLEWQAKDT